MITLSAQVALSSADSIFYEMESDRANALIFEKYRSPRVIKRILARKTIYPRFRIYVLNRDETVKYRIPDEDILVGGSYSENYQNGSRRTLSFSLNNESGKYTPSVDNLWIGTKIGYEVGLDVPDDGITMWFKKGVYQMSLPRPNRDPSKRTISIGCQDKFNMFEGNRGVIHDALEIPTGTKIRDILTDILNTDMGDGYVFDTKPMLYDRAFENVVTPQKISLQAGAHWSDLIIQLAEMLSAEVFYNADGRLVVTPIIDIVSDGDKPAIYDYDENFVSSENFDFDMSNVINTVYVIGANIRGYTHTALAENTDPVSPICVSRIGRHIGPIINDSNITNTVLAQERADYELRKNIILGTKMNSEVMFNPLISVNNIVTFTDEFFKLKRNRFLIQSISHNIGYDGKMSITATNINNLPFMIA